MGRKVMVALVALTAALMLFSPDPSQAGGRKGGYLSTGGVSLWIGTSNVVSPFRAYGHHPVPPYRGGFYRGRSGYGPWFGGRRDMTVHLGEGGVSIGFGGIYVVPYGYGFGVYNPGLRPYHNRYRPGIRPVTRIWVPGRMTPGGYVRGYWQERAVGPTPRGR